MANRIVDVREFQSLYINSEEYTKASLDCFNKLREYVIDINKVGKEDVSDVVVKAITLGLGYHSDNYDQQQIEEVLNVLASECSDTKVAYKTAEGTVKIVNLATFSYLFKQPELAAHIYRNAKKDNSEDRTIALELIRQRNYDALLGFIRLPNFSCVDSNLAADIGYALPIEDFVTDDKGNFVSVAILTKKIEDTLHARGTTEIPPAIVTTTKRKTTVRNSKK